MNTSILVFVTLIAVLSTWALYQPYSVLEKAITIVVYLLAGIIAGALIPTEDTLQTIILIFVLYGAHAFIHVSYQRVAAGVEPYTPDRTQVTDYDDCPF